MKSQAQSLLDRHANPPYPKESWDVEAARVAVRKQRLHETRPAYFFADGSMIDERGNARVPCDCEYWSVLSRHLQDLWSVIKNQ